jgi:hypothetical protein
VKLRLGFFFRPAGPARDPSPSATATSVNDSLRRHGSAVDVELVIRRLSSLLPFDAVAFSNTVPAFCSGFYIMECPVGSQSTGAVDGHVVEGSIPYRYSGTTSEVNGRVSQSCLSSAAEP